MENNRLYGWIARMLFQTITAPNPRKSRLAAIDPECERPRPAGCDNLAVPSFVKVRPPMPGDSSERLSRIREGRSKLLLRLLWTHFVIRVDRVIEVVAFELREARLIYHLASNWFRKAQSSQARAAWFR